MTSRLVVNNIDNDTGVTTIRLNPTYSSFELNSAERLRITSGGSVNIGGDYTQTSKKFKVTGNSTFDGGLHVTGLLEGGSGFSIINGNLTLPAYIYHDGDSDTYYGFSSANQFSVFTGGSEKLKITSSAATIKGTTDGVFNLDTTDSRGSFVRFQQGGTTKVWVGCGQGLSAGGVNDLGLLATTSIIMRANGSERLRVNSDGRLFLGSGLNSNADTYKMSIKESSVENAAIMFLDTDNMKGGLCGISKGTNELISGTTNVDFVVGSMYAATHIIASPANNANTVIAATVEHSRIKLWKNTLISNNVVPTGNTNSNIISERLQILPSENDGYDDSHILSAAQTAGNWEQGAGTSNYDTSWGWIWQYAANSGTTKQVRAGIAYDHKGSEQMKYWSSYGPHVFYTDAANSGNETAETCDTKALVISKEGHVTKPQQPNFVTYSVNSDGSANSNNFLNIGYTYINIGSDYNTSNGRFTCPTTGVYFFYCCWTSDSNTNSPVIYFFVNGSQSQNGALNYNSQYAGTYLGQCFSLNANDYVQCSMRDWNNSAPSPWQTWWGGYLLQ